MTGKGIAANMREHYPRWLLRAIVGLLLVANIINLGADLGAMGEALRLLIGGPAVLYVVAFAVLCALLEIFSRYERYVKVLKWLTLSLFAYVATVLVVEVPWREVALSTRSCRISSGSRTISSSSSPCWARRSAPICFSGRPRRRPRTSASTRPSTR